MKINDWHRAVLVNYADGDFAHLLTNDELYPVDLAKIGDSLLLFLLHELSAEEDCESLEVAIERVDTGIQDLYAAQMALIALQEAIEAKTAETPA